MKTKIISLSSTFPAAPEEVWTKLLRAETLFYIAAPYTYFSPVGASSTFAWGEGETAQFRLKIFGFIPGGIHTINVIECNGEEYRIRSHEGNPGVPIWNHTITLKPAPNGTTQYEDRVELGAGWRTGLAVLWGRTFYRHRQRKWHKLLRHPAS